MTKTEYRFYMALFALFLAIVIIGGVLIHSANIQRLEADMHLQDTIATVEAY